MSPFPSWHFRAMDRGEINVDPVHDEFFKAQDLADALVREAIQNSLDARRGHSTVRVRFRFACDGHALAPSVAGAYLRGLAPHLQASGLPADVDGTMPFLLIEDSGTRGLTGDPGQDPELDENARGASRNDFYYFWRNVGRSGKGELDRGRWGLGKAVFSVSSHIRTMFGLTFRSDDERRLLLGQSVLKTHVLNGTRHAPYGFFARVGSDHFPLALDAAADLERFAADFGIQRTEPGLSIVVPFYRHEDLRFEQIVASAIHQYFYPIIRNDLVVTVEENDTVETINTRTIEAVAQKYGLDEKLTRLCALTRRSLLLDEHEWIPVAEPGGGGAPKWSEEPLSAARLDALRHRFESGDLLAFRIALPVRRKRSRAATATFSVILEKDDSLRRGEHHFIRRGITIPEVRSARDKPVRAVLIADDEALSTFLGDAENPAHSDWSERNDKVRNHYEHGASTLRYVKNAITQLTAVLATPPAGRAPDLLADVFSVKVDGAESDQGPSHRRSTPEATVAPPDNDARIAIKAGEQKIRIASVAGGFTVRGGGTPSDSGTVYVAEIAYRTRVGNPFRKYSPFDFRLDDGISIINDGTTIGPQDGNRLEFVPSKSDFHITLTGFDPRRDLVVRVTKKDDDHAPEAELH